jgi:hypothetical protein
MANTMTLIASSTVGAGGAASIDFTSISGSYTDLCVLTSLRAVDSANNFYLAKVTFNSDTTAGNYSSRLLGAFGSTVYSATNTYYSGYIPSAARTANTFGNNQIYIPNYAGSNQKSISTDSVTEGNGSSYEILGLWAGKWTGTSAITSISIASDTGNLAQYSTAYLYGVKNA